MEQTEKAVNTATNYHVKPKKNVLTPKNAPYVFMAPAFLLIVIFTVYPVISSFILSFQEVRG
ncbi:hypothetical protein [Neobacillus sp. 19]|uniref:hypothetical protein n=1 Tax=Neobacillus sp. 19 TaxID=3394458 RepID=UPI003BF6547D